MRGRKPIPKSGTLAATPLSALPRCPDHLNDVARKEWRRLATPLFDAGILTLADRAALAAYCVAYARGWLRVAALSNTLVHGAAALRAERETCEKRAVSSRLPLGA